MNREIAAFISIMVFIIWVLFCYHTDVIERTLGIIGKLIK
jgi:hypothetical protein